MDKNKTHITIASIIVIMVVMFVSIVLITQRDYVRVTAVEYNAVLANDDSGKLIVTEKMTFDIHASEDSPDGRFWELYRVLPEEWINGTRVAGFNVISVNRISINGQPAPLEFEKADNLYWDDYDYISNAPGYGPNKWHHSEGPYNDYNRFESLIIYVDGLYREQVEFEFKYEIYGATVNYIDYSEIYMPMYESSEINHLKSFKGSLSIPNNRMPSNYHAFSYGTTKHEFEFETKNENNYTTFSFDLKGNNLKFRKYNEYLEFSLIGYGADKHKLAPLARNATDSNYALMMQAQEEFLNLPVAQKALKIKVLIVLSIISILILLIIFLTHKYKKKKYKFFKPTLEYDFFREIPSELDSNFAASFAFCKHKLSDEVAGGYAAAMLGLVRKNYIEVERIDIKKKWLPKNCEITVLDGASKQLSEIEAIYFKLINRFTVNRKIKLDTLQQSITNDYDYSISINNEVKSTIKNIGVSKGYFSTRNYKKPKIDAIKNTVLLSFLGIGAILFNFISYATRLDLAFGGFFILGLSFIIGAIILNVFARSYVLLTQLGEDEYSKWRGLYNFLNSETLIKERGVEEVAIWEDYLLYATAFGISDKVVKALNVKFPEFNPTNSTIISHPFLTTHVFMYSYSRSLSRTIRTASISRAVGNFSGYSSGGRGGGFGGGGH